MDIGATEHTGFLGSLRYPKAYGLYLTTHSHPR